MLLRTGCLLLAVRALWVALLSERTLLAPVRMPPAALRLVRMMRAQVWNTALRLQVACLLASPLALHLVLLPGRVPPCHFPRGRSSPPSSRRRRKSFSCAMGLPSVRRRLPRCSCRGAAVPFIRDELVISLNTVHAHARNIYSKCGVHSQQEFMDFVHLDSREGE